MGEGLLSRLRQERIKVDQRLQSLPRVAFDLTNSIIKSGEFNAAKAYEALNLSARYERWEAVASTLI